MSKHELLEYLLNHRDYFKKVSLEDFSLLASLEPSELGFMNYDNYQVTPLLQQICNYALVDTNLTQENTDDIANNLSSNEEQEFVEDALDMANKCCGYVDILLQEGANHPCLVNVNYLINGAFLYNQITESICELIKVTDDRFQDDLIDFGNIIDEKIIDMKDDMWNELLKTMGKITSEVDVLNRLSDYTKKILVMKNFFSLNQNRIDYIEDTYIHFVARERIHPNFNLSIGDCMRSLSIIIGKADQYQEYSSDDEVLGLIKNLEEGYSLYNSYRYLYLKNQYREAKMLEKCKKM